MRKCGAVTFGDWRVRRRRTLDFRKEKRSVFSRVPPSLASVVLPAVIPDEAKRRSGIHRLNFMGIVPEILFSSLRRYAFPVSRVSFSVYCLWSLICFSHVSFPLFDAGHGAAYTNRHYAGSGKTQPRQVISGQIQPAIFVFG